MPRIAPSATVDPKAELASDVEVGSGCYVGPLVKIGSGCRLLPNVTILGHTFIGSNNLFYPGAVIGAAPQDLKYQGEDTRLLIGNDNIFREYVTAHPGTENGGGITEIGNHNQFQVGTHLAHDVFVGSHCILSNSVQIAGHVHIEDHVNIAGMVGVQQFVTLGKFCFLGGATRCAMDVPPFCILSGYEGAVTGANYKGLSRWGFDERSIQQIRDTVRRVFPAKHQASNGFGVRSLYSLLPSRKRDQNNGRSTLLKRVRDVEGEGSLNEHCQYLIDFVKRSINNGVNGRYLESLRRDNGQNRSSFYAVGSGTSSSGVSSSSLSAGLAGHLGTSLGTSTGGSQ